MHCVRCRTTSRPPAWSLRRQLRQLTLSLPLPHRCEQMYKDPSAMPEQPYNLGQNETVYVPPNFDCESCLPETRDALSCRLGENWRYCSVETNPGLRDAMLSGCGDPYGQCTFWRSAIEEACPLPYNCPSEDRQALIAVVASCSEGDGPVCAATTLGFPGPDYVWPDRLAMHGESYGYNSDPSGYNALRPAWVMSNIPQQNIDLVGGVPTQPRSRAAQAIYLELESHV